MIRHPKYNRGNIYLSGGMQFAKDKGSNWREECSKKLISMQYFPIDICELDRAYAKEHGVLFYKYKDDFNESALIEFKSNIRKHFHYTDCELVRKDSDAIIVLWDESAQRGAGTHSEAHVAYENDIPVLVVNTMPLSEVPGWFISESTKIFNSFDELYEYLEKLPNGILCRDSYGNHRSGNQYLCSLCGDPFTKGKHHFVSKVKPLLCTKCVDVVTKTNEAMKDRYDFFIEYYENEALEELKKI